MHDASNSFESYNLAIAIIFALFLFVLLSEMLMSGSNCVVDLDMKSGCSSAFFCLLVRMLSNLPKHHLNWSFM